MCVLRVKLTWLEYDACPYHRLPSNVLSLKEVLEIAIKEKKVILST